MKVLKEGEWGTKESDGVVGGRPMNNPDDGRSAPVPYRLPPYGRGITIVCKEVAA